MGVNRTSKTPTSIYLANRGFKTSNIPLVNEKSVPDFLINNPKSMCVVGLTTEPERLYDLRRKTMTTINENEKNKLCKFRVYKNRSKNALNTFKKYQWPVIDVTRKSVEETAASVIKIYEISKKCLI